MLNQSYSTWSDEMLLRANKTNRADWSQHFIEKINHILPEQDDEEVLEQLVELWGNYLQNAASNGLVFNQPGRLLRPGTLRHSPILRLVPLPDKLRHGRLGKKLKSRFKAYKNKVVKPFYKDYFSDIDRQVVLVDILQTLELGEAAYNELVDALKVVLKSFQYGKGSILDWLKGHHTTHVLFAATKADHVIRGDRANLEKMLRKIIRQADDGNQLKSSVKHYDIIEIASVKASEDRMTIKPPKREILYGHPLHAQESGAYDPGGLPLDIPPDWPSVEFQFLQFKPPPMPRAFDEGFPSINLGKALEFLIKEDFN